MTKKTTVKTLFLIAATALGVAATASAQNTMPAAPDNPPPPGAADSSYQTSRYGLLGERYTGVDYSYTHVHDSYLDNLNGFALRYNQPMEPGFDFSLGYEWARSNEYAGIRGRQEELTASVTAFTDYNGMRPFIEPGVGWTWAKVGSVKSDSFLYYVGTGVEFQVMRPWVVTPYVRFVDATDYDGTTWNFGIKSAYRLSQAWGVNVDLSTDDDQNTGFAAGVNYHF